MKTSAFRFFLLAALLLTGLLAHSSRPIPAGSAPATACCDTQPLTLLLGQKPLFIPNAFTPNGDGFNDYFLPVTSDSSLRVRDFTILNDRQDSILFHTSSINYSAVINKAQSGWNGRRKDGTHYQGRFTYRLWVETHQVNPQLIQGAGCALLGSAGLKIVQSSDGCLFVQ